MRDDFLKYNIEVEDKGIKLDSILRTKLNLSRRLIIWLKKTNGIYLNNKSVHTDAIVNPGDIVSVNIGREERQDIEPQDIPVDVIFEDKDLLVVNKQPGLVVHPTKGHPQGTLSNGIMYHWMKKGEEVIVRLVNRLDRDTSGLVIIAKNQFTHQAMAKQLESNQVRKIYLCIVHGIVEEDMGTIDLPIDRPTFQSIKREVMEEGSRAVTHFKTIERFDDASLLQIRLETGKTHQIRVHMSHIGHSIFGDTLYGKSDDGLYIARQALHAAQLVFTHPRNGNRMEFKTQLPEDMSSLLEKLGAISDLKY